ncbi:hypothetical protein G6F60_015189 [Rhizopus arrhizus]|nr:hypothetical protein G6F60_015189 [Rhizopus arrhizus]
MNATSAATSSGWPNRPTGICGNIFSFNTSSGTACTMRRHGEAVDARLRRGIVRLAELALLPVQRADVDDAAPLTLDPALDDLLGHIEETVQVGHRA